ncbi:tetratricopeptide repeat protein [Klebsiella variicola]|uniref:tetratricopeptide repeat protein n=1 Tax=Klebsiella variicola TaxID=244366 RepID=UPI001E58423A|nr:tetratricopeptide repeat protein [Klebsiella variicola]
MYDVGIGVEKDYQTALQLYLKAAEQGDAKAQFNLGIMYDEGKVGQDYQAARQWYLKAADQGDAGSENNLGLIYFKGKGVRRDLATARFYFRKACDKGYYEGCHNYRVFN